MFIMMPEKGLEGNHPFCKTMLEMISHQDEPCKNEVCELEGWSKKKVLHVFPERIG